MAEAPRPLRLLGRGLRRLLRVLAWPARAGRSRGGGAILAYRGYGTRDEVFLMGRVFRQATRNSTDGQRALGRDLLDLLRRLLRRGVPDARLVLSCGGHRLETRTDRDGFFRFRGQLEKPLEGGNVWQRGEVELLEPQDLSGSRSQAEIYLAPGSARLAVISDIDDTVMFTGVAQRLRMIWRLFFQGAARRAAFPGAASFYRSLHQGAGGEERNPMLYVSRGPWTLYEVLDAFFNLNRIPAGPVLFLRDWGIRLHRPFPRKAQDHKVDLIREMLEVYRHLPFLLIGDSGQHDPEVYAQVVREFPGRVRGVYIRDVTRNPERTRAIAELAREVREAGSDLVLAADSFAMAEHAAAAGIIGPDDLEEILAERPC